MEERRRFCRLALDLPVTLRHDGRLIPATVLNISCGGMSLRAEAADIADGGSVEVIFDLNEEKRDLSLLGRITRISEQDEASEMGVQFTNLFSLSYKAVQEYLQKHLH